MYSIYENDHIIEQAKKLNSLLINQEEYLLEAKQGSKIDCLHLINLLRDKYNRLMNVPHDGYYRSLIEKITLDISGEKINNCEEIILQYHFISYHYENDLSIKDKLKNHQTNLWNYYHQKIKHCQPDEKIQLLLTCISFGCLTCLDNLCLLNFNNIKFINHLLKNRSDYLFFQKKFADHLESKLRISQPDNSVVNNISNYFITLKYGDIEAYQQLKKIYYLFSINTIHELLFHLHEMKSNDGYHSAYIVSLIPNNLMDKHSVINHIKRTVNQKILSAITLLEGIANHDYYSMEQFLMTDISIIIYLIMTCINYFDEISFVDKMTDYCQYLPKGNKYQLAHQDFERNKN